MPVNSRKLLGGIQRMRVNLSTRRGRGRHENGEQSRSRRIAGVTADDHVVVVLFDGDLGLDGIGIAENAVVEIGRVAQVEQIVDDELVVGANGDPVPFGRVHLRDIVEHAEVRHLRKVGRLSPIQIQIALCFSVTG